MISSRQYSINIRSSMNLAVPITLRKVGVPKEIKQHEYRVAMTPAGVKTLVKKGCDVFVEKNAGTAAGFKDTDYSDVGALVVNKEEVFSQSDMIVKVKEPLPSEYGLIKLNQVVFTFFHFAGIYGLEDEMGHAGAICIAYETVQKENGHLPILAPMSEVAGRLAVQEGMRFLTKNNAGMGMLLSGIPGVEPAKVVVIGAGTVGLNATKLAAGLGATVYILDNNLEKLRQVSSTMPNNVITVYSTEKSIGDKLKEADLVIGSVLVPGKAAPKLVSSDMLMNMKEGSVFVDVAIDQGGMTEVSKPTSHDNPVFKYGPVTMYCVANMPGIVPYTSTMGLTNATLPYIVSLVNDGVYGAAKKYPELKPAISSQCHDIEF